MKHRRVAGYRMRSTNDTVLDAVVKRIGGEIQAPLKLMRLHTGKGKEGRNVVPLQQAQIREVRLDILVDNVSFDRVSFQCSRRHAFQVRNRRIRHETASESLDAAGLIVLARLQDQDAKLIHGTSSDRHVQLCRPSDRGTSRWKNED
jgi:hypothetical protein